LTKFVPVDQHVSFLEKDIILVLLMLSFILLGLYQHRTESILR
jgi:hypothetical protein